MIVGILGLGLIGGSMARAYSMAGHTVYAAELDHHMLSFAQLAGAVDGDLTDQRIPECDLLLLAIYPQGCCQWLEEKAPLISSKVMVLDLCGVKQSVCQACFPLAEQFGFSFIGGHPMAGTHFSGFKYSRADLFSDAPMVLVPPRFDDIALLDKAKQALAPCGFGSFSVTTAEAHDRMIAFTSQMPHIISNAFIKSPTADGHAGFSAGSYRDLTRVARLNPSMWAELFLENRTFLLDELSIYLDALEACRMALEESDKAALIRLLEEGRQRKEAVDG